MLRHVIATLMSPFSIRRLYFLHAFDTDTWSCRLTPSRHFGYVILRHGATIRLYAITCRLQIFRLIYAAVSLRFTSLRCYAAAQR